MATKKGIKSASRPTLLVQTRPPVVVVMGHVDHGKTTLLDAIRTQTYSQKPESLTAKEHGGITQHIGAYQVEVPLKEKPQQARDDFASRKITFLDTPGHEAFAKMRSRGASVADLAILVVAANDGVNPQTKEAITHIKAAQIPMVVAINKIDLPEASVEMVKGQLAENEIFVEGYGGDVVYVAVSAKQGQGIEQLLEMILLVAEMAELSGSPKHPLSAYVLESFVDAHRGVVANLLVKDGKLSIGDQIQAFTPNQPHQPKIAAKVKLMVDEYGKRIGKALPSQPVQVLGFKTLPLVGAQVTPDHQKIKTEMERTVEPIKETPAKVTGDKAPEEVPKEARKLTLILKADVQGSLEAIKANLTEEVELVGEGMGDINESDILLADSTGAKIIGFNVKIPTLVAKLAQMEKVKIKTYTVIYHLLEDVQKEVLKLIEPTINEIILGKAKVIAEFVIKKSHIAGCKVTEGSIHKANRVRVMRGEEVIGEARIVSFQRQRQEVTEVKKGDEVGVVLRPDLPFNLSDVIISYKVEE